MNFPKSEVPEETLTLVVRVAFDLPAPPGANKPATTFFGRKPSTIYSRGLGFSLSNCPAEMRSKVLGLSTEDISRFTDGVDIPSLAR